MYFTNNRELIVFGISGIKDLNIFSLSIHMLVCKMYVVNTKLIEPRCIKYVETGNSNILKKLW